MMAQTTPTRARMCLFRICSHGSSFKTPPKPPFWGVNRRFQAKLAKLKNVHIIKTTASIPTKLCTVINTKCPSGMVPTNASQIQYGGRLPFVLTAPSLAGSPAHHAGTSYLHQSKRQAINAWTMVLASSGYRVSDRIAGRICLNW